MVGLVLLVMLPAVAVGGPTSLQHSDDLAIVRVIVTDPGVSRLVTGLQADGFRLLEDGNPKPIKSFSDQPGPVSLAVVLDLSSSVWDRTGQYRAWAESIIATPLQCGEWTVLAVAREIVVLKELDEPEPLKDSRDSLADLNGVVKADGSCLLDALLVAAETLRNAGKYRNRAIVLISDGEENRSRYRLKEIRSRLQGYGIRVYYVGTKGELGYGPEILQDLAESTGGFGKVPSLPKPSIALDLVQGYVKAQRHEYVLGYESSVDRRHRREKLKIQVPGMKVSCWVTLGDHVPAASAAR